MKAMIAGVLGALTMGGASLAQDTAPAPTGPVTLIQAGRGGPAAGRPGSG